MIRLVAPAEVAKILRGAKGITVPSTLLALTDEVVE
jgi:hypothetical protein